MATETSRLGSGLRPFRRPKLELAPVVVVAALLLTGCGRPEHATGGRDAANAERRDSQELDFVPSIIASARRLVDDVQTNHGPTFRRDAHAKGHGCVTATFTVLDDLPEALRSSVFVAGRSYDAWIRFSNGNADLQADNEKDARGMAIKLMGVKGRKLLTSADEQGDETQDFLMINHPVFFNRDPSEYERFIHYQSEGSKYAYFFEGRNPLHWHLQELLIGDRVLGRIRSPLYTQYYSMTAYALGVEHPEIDPAEEPHRPLHAMKYSARSCSQADHLSPAKQDRGYLSLALKEHLAKAGACFDFVVQVQDPTKNMPIEDPTVEWSESDAPFQPVARITIPAQVFDSPEQVAFCENLSFSPWHGNVDHRPLGGLNRIRRAVYEGIAVYRHALNHVDVCEPTVAGKLGLSCPKSAIRNEAKPQ